MVLVTAVIPVYNQERYLGEAIDSVLGQTFRDVELIVVDDGSTDRTAEVIASYGSGIRTVYKPNGGNASALNRGIREARGRWIGWLSSDDLWEPTKLARQIAVLEREPSVDLIYTGYYVIDPEGRVLERVTPPFPPTHRKFMLRLVRRCFVNGSSVLVRREVFNEVGFFDEADRLTSDYDLWLRMAPRCNFRGIPDPLVRYRIHPGQLSRKREAMERSRKRVAARGCRRMGSLTGATAAVLRLRDEALLAPWLVRTGQATPRSRALAFADTLHLFVNPDAM
jgi:glycosyltransferase involved in cell wall biosynthesis